MIGAAGGHGRDALSSDAAGDGRAARPCGALACGRSACWPTARCSASVPTTTGCGTANPRACRRPTAACTATTCTSRCWSAAGIVGGAAFAWLFWAPRRRTGRRPARAARGTTLAPATAGDRRGGRRHRLHGAGRFVPRASRATYTLLPSPSGSHVSVSLARRTGPMRIAFDGTTLRPGRTGVGYYTEHLLHHLAARAGDDRDRRHLEPPGRHDAPAAGATCGSPRSPRRIPRMVWMQTLGAAAAAAAEQADVVHFTNGMVPLASPVPTVVTIHDMSLTLYPALPSAAARAAEPAAGRPRGAPRRRHHHRLARAPSATSSACTACRPSACTSCTRRRRRRSGPFTISAELERVRRRYGLADRFILYVGTIEPRKNLPRLIEALRAAPQGRRSAASARVRRARTAGSRRDIEDRIERARRSRDAIRFTGYVPFEDLPALYSLAEMFVFPSLYEGFGLPVIEAMACGDAGHHGRTCRRWRKSPAAPSSRSIASTPTRWARRWSRWRAAASAASTCRRSACSARATFSWDRAARETLEVYRPGRAKPAAARPAPRTRRRRRRAGRPVRTSARTPSASSRRSDLVHDRRPVRPGVLPALRSEALGGAAAVRAARRAVCGGRRAGARATTSRCSTRCSRSRRTSGPTRSIAIARASR